MEIGAGLEVWYNNNTEENVLFFIKGSNVFTKRSIGNFTVLLHSQFVHVMFKKYTLFVCDYISTHAFQTPVQL